MCLVDYNYIPLEEGEVKEGMREKGEGSEVHEGGRGKGT